MVIRFNTRISVLTFQKLVYNELFALSSCIKNKTHSFLSLFFVLYKERYRITITVTLSLVSKTFFLKKHKHREYLITDYTIGENTNCFTDDSYYLIWKILYVSGYFSRCFWKIKGRWMSVNAFLHLFQDHIC